MVRQAEGFTNYVQFDIMDGQFVPSKSITSEHLADLSTTLSWEAHLMVQQPDNYLESFRKAGAQKIIFHYEATSSPEKVIFKARNLGLEVGLAVNPETPLSIINSLISQIDSVLFLTVNPGFYGSPFIPEALDKAIELRRTQPNLEIGVDGGMKESNIAQIAQLGIDMICVGSAIFSQPDPGESFRHLSALAEEGSRRR
jgi:ribulose-phosphate 3-epimerase